MNKVIAFTQKHENQLDYCSAKIEENSKKIDELSSATVKNTTAIVCLSSNVQRLSSDVERLSTNVDRLSTDVDRLSTEVHRLSPEVHRLGILMENQNSNIQTILEVVTHIDKRFQRQDKTDAKVENHENRISAIELTLKSNN